jgi:hypothetical protein
MSNYSPIPGVCVMCGGVDLLRSLPDGYVYDGICERCDEARFRQLHPRMPWVSWRAQRELRNARENTKRAVRALAMAS